MIKIKNLTKIFTLGDNKLIALNNLGFLVPSGQFLAITGISGSGKSTLCRQKLLTAQRLLVFDTISEYRRLSPPYPAITVCDLYDLMDYLTQNANKNFRLIFDPSDPEEVPVKPDQEPVKVDPTKDISVKVGE